MRLLTINPISLFAMTLIFAGVNSAHGEEEPEFSKQTIDIGVVVSDQAASLKFYTEAIGMKEMPGFEVASGLASEAGLTKESSLSIKVVTLGEDKTATRLKLVKVNGVQSAGQPNDFIETHSGLSYLTVYVTDMDSVVARLKKQDVAILAKGPVALPADMAPGVFLTLVRDPDGNFVELVGPNAKTEE